jgi:heat shock protein HtpX
MLLYGLYLSITGFPQPTSLLIGFACCGMGWLSLPWPTRLPKDAVQPEEFPALHALVNEVTAKLGGKPVRYIVVDEVFNASYAVAGWRREPVLTLGLPMWMALPAHTRLALIGHEIAHGINGDAMRGFVIGSALHALQQWIELLRGSRLPASGMEALAGHLTRVMAFPLAALRALLMHLLWQVKQRSEYFADYLAATIAGTPATVDLLERSAMGEHLDAVLLRHAFSTAQSGDYILGLFWDRIASLPSRELERLRRASKAEGAQLDSTHPPTEFRKAFLIAHAIEEPQLAVDECTMDAIDAELRRLTNKLGGRLIARYARD